MDAKFLYRIMCRIRFFEELVLEKFPTGVFVGTTHTYLGQEANAVGVIANLQAEDIIFSNHRGHGHFLAYGGEPRALFAELMGKKSGVCGGRGGSQHLHWKNFYSNGVQGGIVPIATGMALAEKQKQSGAIAVAFLGDGTLGEGVIYETFNMASKWQIPILYVVENNRIAQTTPIELSLAGSIAARFHAFGIACEELDTSDVVEICDVAARWVNRVRQNQAPGALILHTWRFGPHSKGDDTRPAEEIAFLKETRDPLKIQAARLAPGEREAIEAEEQALIEQAFQLALEDEYPAPEDALTPGPSPEGRGEIDSLSLRERVRVRDENFESPVALTSDSSPTGRGEDAEGRKKPVTVLQSLNLAIHQALAKDERVFLLGQDILDPYGGAFKVTQGCSTHFPQRVFPTPISEAGLVGIAAGMALRGLLPLAEIMFGDFLTLIADQVINHIAKFRWMYHDAVKVPLVIRTPVGGGRGYGPTHSQSLEKLYLGVPGIHVVAVTHFGEPQALLLQAIFQDSEPVIFIEHKSLYPLTIWDDQDRELEREVGWTELGYPIYTLRLRGSPPANLTLIAYSYMAEVARQAMIQLAYQAEIFCELVVPTQLRPCAEGMLRESVQRTGRALVIEEGTLSFGWGAEILARIAEHSFSPSARLGRIGAAEHPVPASPPLERVTLPGVEDIIRKARNLLKP
jgi:2-oxoisovalerate dehydrogenase E1 component